MSPTSKYAGTAANVVTFGNAWSSTSNATGAPDGVKATASTPNPADTTDGLKLTNFGFAIPATAIIDGVMAEIYRSGTLVYSFSAKIVKAGTAAGTTKFGTGSDVWASGTTSTWGGSTDLWGTTLTYSDINDSGFGVQIEASNTSGGGGSAAVDGARITVYWHTTPTEVPKRYIYKIFDVSNNYLGVLKPVTSKFEIAQDINTAGSQLLISVGTAPDKSAEANTTIDDETGVALQDESSNSLLTERMPDVFGNDNNSILIRNGNRIKVYEVSYYYPNGKLMFSGQINRWEALFGAESSDDQINVTALSDGADFGYYLMTTGGTADQSNTSVNSTYTTYNNRGVWIKAGQSWTTGGAVTTLAQIGIFANTGGVNQTVSIKAYSDSTLGSLLGTATQVINSVVATEFTFTFTPIITVVAGQSYFFVVEPPTDGSNLILSYSTANPYANGAMYTSSYGGGGGGSFGATTGDLYFKTYSGGNVTDVTYTAQDPSTMALDILSRYNSKGGIVTGSTTTAPTSGVSATYTFKLATILEGIQKCRELSPANWYWYVDIGTSILTLKSTASTAAYTLVKGKHIEHLKLAASIEDVVNTLMFSGGPTAGVNLYTQASDQTSIASYGQRIDKKSDNRVTVSATANLITTAFVSSRKDEKYVTRVVIPDRTMDITLPRVGDVIGFAGFGSFIDRLLLQIVRLEYTANKLTLDLGILPQRGTTMLTQAVNDIELLQSLANPTTPS